VVIDLFARNVVGWSMKPTLSRELALDALMMAVWRRKPDGEVKEISLRQEQIDLCVLSGLISQKSRVV